MTPSPKELTDTLLRYLGKALTGPRRLARATAAATLSVAQSLLYNRPQLVKDIRRIKKSLIKGLEADTDKKLAEATEAANRAARSKRSKAIIEAEARAELDKTRAQARKAIEDAKAVKSDAKVRRKLADAQARLKEAQAKDREAAARLRDAQARFVDALQQLRSEGAQFYIDKKELKKLLGDAPARRGEG